MDIVEQKLAGLESLPGRMTALESQFLQLRAEMRAEFSAVRSEMHVSVDEAKDTLRKEIRAGDEETRRVLREEISAVRKEMQAGHAELRQEIAGLGTHMRVLHEALVDQIKLIQEGRPNRPRSRR